ncbi:hypothetical protein FQN52_005040 [Onygenales sp. PD_12]|nr:hypothetical protein FQN52_005040 [Onygenales sp. PD_12]
MDNEKRASQQLDSVAVPLPPIPPVAKPENGTSNTPSDAEETLEYNNPTDEETTYPTFWKLVLLSIALCLALFCISLDQTILATAIPKITDQFESVGDNGWYSSSYLFATASTQLFFGKLYTMYSAKWIFLAGLAIFEIGSLIAGAATSSAMLIAGRTVSGVGAASLFPGSIIIIVSAVPLRQRPIYVSLLGSMHGVASIVGPLLGGVFTDHISWRWCFYINLPLGAITAICLLFFFPPGAPPQGGLPWNEQLKHFDLIGSFFLIPGVTCLLLALQWGGRQGISKYPWSDARIIALLSLSGVLLVIFCAIQVWQKDKATVPSYLIRNRNMFGALLYIMGISGAMFICMYYLPWWFQAVKSVSATKSGIMSLPTMLGLVISSIICGFLVTALGYYTPFLIVSSMVGTVGAGLLTLLKTNSGASQWLGYQVILSVGLGMGAQNAFLIPQVAVPKTELATATAVLTFIQTLTSAIFLAIGQAVFQNQLVNNLAVYAPSISPELVFATGPLRLQYQIPAESLPAVVGAFNAAITEVFYVAVAGCALSVVGPLFLEWKSLKKAEHKE